MEAAAGALTNGGVIHAQADEVRKKYLNGFEAVKGVSFEVWQGDCLGLLGENGAGKTTVCNMVTGLLPPSKGDIKVHVHAACPASCALPHVHSLNDSLGNSVQVWNTAQGSDTTGSLGICAQHTVLPPTPPCATFCTISCALRAAPRPPTHPMA